MVYESVKKSNSFKMPSYQPAKESKFTSRPFNLPKELESNLVPAPQTYFPQTPNTSDTSNVVQTKSEGCSEESEKEENTSQEDILALSGQGESEKPIHENLDVSSTGVIQRLCSECEQKQDAEEKTHLQTKLSIGTSGDKYEQEADNMPSKVMSMPTSTDDDHEKSEASIQKKPLAYNVSPLIQHQIDLQKRQNQVKPINTSVNPLIQHQIDLQKRQNQVKPINTSVNPLIQSFRQITESDHPNSENTEIPKEQVEQTTSSVVSVETKTESHETTKNSKKSEKNEKSAADPSVEISDQPQQSKTQDTAAPENTAKTSPIAEKTQEQALTEKIKLPSEAAASDQKAQVGKTANQTPDQPLTQVPEAQVLKQAVTQNQEVSQSQSEGNDPTTQDTTTAAEKSKNEAQIGQSELAATNTQVAQLASAGVSFGTPDPETDQASTVISRKSEPGSNQLAFLEQQRAAASNQASAFLGSAALKVQTITGLGENIPARILATTESAKANVLAAVEPQKAAVTAHITQLRAQAQAEAQTALAQIQTQQQTALAGISQSTATAKTKLEAEFTKANAGLAEKETGQIAKIEELYQQALPKYQAAGEKVGNEAIAVANKSATGYESQITGKDDSLLD